MIKSHLGYLHRCRRPQSAVFDHYGLGHSSSQRPPAPAGAPTAAAAPAARLDPVVEAIERRSIVSTSSNAVFEDNEAEDDTPLLGNGIDFFKSENILRSRSFSFIGMTV